MAFQTKFGSAWACVVSGWLHIIKNSPVAGLSVENENQCCSVVPANLLILICFKRLRLSAMVYSMKVFISITFPSMEAVFFLS